MAIEVYKGGTAAVTPANRLVSISPQTGGEIAAAKQDEKLGGIISGAGQMYYEQRGRAQLMQAVNEYNNAMSLENDRLRQLKEGNAAGNVDAYINSAEKNRDKLLKKYEFLRNGKMGEEFNRMTFQSAMQGRNSMQQYVHAETEKQLETEYGTSMQNIYKEMADNPADTFTFNMGAQRLQDAVALRYGGHSKEVQRAAYNKAVDGYVRTGLDAMLARSDYEGAQAMLKEHGSKLDAAAKNQYTKVVEARMQMNRDIDFTDGLAKKYGYDYAKIEEAINSGKELPEGGEMPLLETAVQDGIEDTGLAKTKPALKKGVDMLNAWVNSSFGGQLVISGGWRSKEHNAEVNGAENSHHLYGDALDVVIPENFSEEQISAVREKAKSMGFNADGEDMYHDKGSGYHLHLTLPKGLNAGNAPMDNVRKKQLLSQVQTLCRQHAAEEKAKHDQQVETLAGSISRWKEQGVSVRDAMNMAAQMCGTDYKALSKMQTAIGVFYNEKSVPMTAEQAAEVEGMIIDGASQQQIMEYCRDKGFSGSQTMSLLGKNRKAIAKQGVYQIDTKGLREEVKERLKSVLGQEPSKEMLNSSMRIVTEWAQEQEKKDKNGALPSRYDLISKAVKAASRPVESGVLFTAPDAGDYAPASDFRTVEQNRLSRNVYGYTETDYENKGISHVARVQTMDKTLYYLVTFAGEPDTQVKIPAAKFEEYMRRN